MGTGRATRRLAQLAQLAGAERAPYYVRRPIPPTLEDSFPAEGWYWVPPGHSFAVFLGASEITAAVKLTNMIHSETNGHSAE